MSERVWLCACGMYMVRGGVGVCVSEFSFSAGKKKSTSFLLSHLSGNVRVLDVVLQVRHEHQVTGLEPAIMHGMVVDLTQDGARAETISGVLSIDVLAQFVHQLF